MSGVGGEVPPVELSVVIAHSRLPVADNESIRLNQAHYESFLSCIVTQQSEGDG